MLKKRLFRILKWFFGIMAGLVVLITVLLYIYKDEICGLIVDELNKHLKSEVHVGEIELTFWGTFPDLSIDFNEVFIQDSYENSTKFDTLLYSERIRLKLNPLDIWRENYTVKSLEVNPGVLNLKVNSEGVNNYDILKESKKEEDTPFELKLEEVYFEGFRFAYINAATQQEYRTKLNSALFEGAFSEDQFTASTDADLQILSARSGTIDLVQNKPARVKVSVIVNKDSSLVRIPKSTVYVANLPFDFDAEVRDSAFNVHLKGKNIGIEDAANNLAMKEVGEVKKFKGKGKFLFDLHIDGTNDPVQPVSVKCSFGVQNASLHDPSSGVRLSELNLNGLYSNKGGPSKEFLQMNDIRARSNAGPFKGQLRITEFSEPLMEGYAHGHLDLEVVHALFPLPMIETLKGGVEVMNADFKVKSHPQAIEGARYDIQRCTGNVELLGVDLSLRDDKRVFRNMRGTVYLRDDELGLEKVSVALGSSDFLLNGVFRNLVKYFQDAGNLMANVEIRSRRINIDEDLGSEEREEKILKERSFVLPNNIEGSLHLDVDKMIYEKHSFEKVSANMHVQGRTLRFERLSLSTGGSQLFGGMTIEEQTPEIFRINSQVVSQNINFTSLFREWDNFKQDAVKSQNIEGDAQANVEFEALFDLRSGIMPSSIVARIGLQIDNGRLHNVESFNTLVASLKSSNVTRLVLSKDEIKLLGEKLKDLRFKRMTNTLVIRDQMLIIPTMTIESSALDITMNGQHSFDNQIDYKFGFYLRDLKIKKETEFGVERDDGTGLNIFVRMYGDLYNPTIEWDKNSRKEHTEAYNKQEKENMKAILKQEFGLFKRDTTVRQFVRTDAARESIELEFDPKEDLDPVLNERKPVREDKRPEIFEKWRKEKETQKRQELDIDDL